MSEPIDKIKDVTKIYPFLEQLSSEVDNLLSQNEQILISVVGKSGTGKSTFGRHVRKKGLGKISPRNISVIDDGVMSLEVFGVFQRKVRIPEPKEMDELKPFLELLPRHKKIIFYINQLPSGRISRTDILLHLKTDQQQRLQQLADRKGGFDKIPESALDPAELNDYGVKTQLTLEGTVFPISLLE